MDVFQATQQRRSIRRFARRPVPREALEKLAGAARMSPTGTNRQPLRFAIISRQALCEKVFPLTHWAMRIPDGSAGPDASTQPAAYVAILVDKRIAPQADTDAGAAAMSMLLVAESLGLATCWLASVDRGEIMALLGLDGKRYAVHTLVALGYPAMRSRAVPMEGESTDYYLESKDMLCVPKRSEKDAVRWFE